MKRQIENRASLWGRIRSMEPYLMLLPVILLLLVFILYPVLNTVRLAFQNNSLMAPNDVYFNGVENFVKIFSDPYFFRILGNTLLFVLSTVTAQFLLGLTLALALNKPFKGRNIYQSIVFLPWSISSLVIGFSFRWMFNSDYGPINDLLLRFGVIDERISFFGESRCAMAVVVIAMVWYGVPFFGIMLSAAFQSVPQDLYEAVSIDGGGAFRKFFSITLPYASPTITMTLLLRTIWVFTSADLIYVLTGGGPANSTHTLASYMFAKAYSTLDFGQTGALGVLFMASLILYSLFYLRVTQYDRKGGLS